MAKVLCVLYDDPVDGYPSSYPRDAIPDPVAGAPFVTFDFGLRLPIAERWTQGPGAFEGMSPVWFVNERGEVIEIPM